MRKNIKRVIAGVLSAVLSLSLVNFSALSVSFASELSGYEIGVEYSEDNTSATLVGNTTGVKEGVQLDKLVDSEGQELDPASFSQTVEENGTYHFTLYYQEAVDTQGADQPTTEEKTQKLEVVVNGIVEPGSQETPAADAEAGTEQEDPVTEMPALPTGDPMTAGQVVPLDVLLKSAAESRATRKVQIYAYEVDYKLRDEAFSGGALVKGAEGLPTASYRAFESAAFVRPGSTTKFYITGLYYYNTKWYYTVEGNSDTSTGIGNVSVGFELPSDATVRLYYELTTTDKHELFFNGGGASLKDDYRLTVNGGDDSYVKLLYPQGRKIVLEFILPAKYSDATISIPEVSFSGNIKGAASQGTPLVDNKIIKVSEYRYTLVFTMPNKNVNINFSGVNWPSNATYNVCLGSGIAAAQVGEYSTNTYFKTTGGTITPATVTHTNGYISGGTIDYAPTRQSLPTGTNQSKDFAIGKYQAGKTVTMELNMDRWRESGPYFVWKPVVLIMQVYLGENFGGQNYTRYYIPLVTSQGGTKTTNLDFGATVTTTCTSWKEKSFTYTITVKNMYHNFAIYDVETSTNQQNFVIENVDGINLSTSKLENKNGTHTLRQWDIWLGKDAKTGSYSMNFFIDSKDGYTAPTFNLTNPLAECVLHPHGYYDHYQYGYHYWWEVEVNKNKNGELSDQNKAPARISITAQPLSFAVKYYYGGNPYHNPNATMSIDKGTNYGIMYKIPEGMNNVKGYNVNVFSKGNYIATITKSDGTDVWYPNKDVINYLQVYNQLRNSGKLPTDPTNCELRIVPVAGDGSQGYVNVNYEVKFQSAYVDMNNTAGSNKLPDGKYTPKSGSFKAYAGSSVMVSGYKDQAPLNGKKYKLNYSASTFGADKVTANQKIATLEYLLATTVTLDGTTLGTGSDVTNADTWNKNHADMWYTSVNNFDHTITDYSSLNAGTKQGEIFAGWGIKKSNGEVVPITDNMKYGGNLNFYMVGTANRDLWSDIFDTGSCTLVAMWASNVAKVTTAGGTTIVDQTGTTVEVLEGQKTMVMSAAFRYANPSVTQQELQALADANQLKVALVKKNPSGTGGWQVRSFDNSQTAGFSRPSITALTNGDFQISFTFTQMSGEQEVELDPTYNDGANFRIFAWTSENAGTDGLTASTICSQLNAAEAATSEENPYVNPYENIVPSVRVPISMLYKVKSADGTSITNKPGTDVEIYGGASSFTISGSFQYGDTTASLNEIQKLYNNGKLKIALIKQNPTGGDWQKRVFGNDATSGFSTPVITGTGSTLKVTFTVSANPIDPQWNDGAKFRIFVWTAANDGGQDLTADGICTALNGASGGNPYDNKIPSVNVQTTMLFKVFSSDGTNITNTDKNLEILDGADSFTLTAEFKYGDTAVTQEKLDALFKNEKLKIGLLKMNPPSSENRAWAIRYGDGDETFGKPTITKKGGSSNFTVSFTVNNAAITGQNNDGASFRILVWTDANDKKADGGSWTITDIMNTLNSAAGENPYDTKLASVTTNTTMLYKVVNDTVSSGSVTVMSTSENITLTGAFKYQYDTNRYSDGFTTENLTQLITDGKIQVKLQKQMKDSSEWVVVPGMDKNALTAGENGAINFNYAFTETGASWANYDGAKFKVTLWTAANGTAETAYPFYTITVTYVADPTAYVDIPKYIILDDNNSNVKNGDVRQDGYAGKQVEVKYNDTTMNAAFKPSIEVKVQDGVLLKEGSISGKPMADMAIGIYDTNGGKISADQGYCSVGTLSATQTSLPFWMNVKRGTVKNQQYYATVMFVLELSGTIA